MPITLPTIDDRRYEQLVNEAIARIPAYTPEYTNFNRSDPGVTLIEAFAFIAETLLYRSNQIPERNRLKFLSLLGVPLQPASSARGLVVFRNQSQSANGTPQTITLQSNVEVNAGNIPFRTEQGLDVLPIEAPVYFKRSVTLEGDPQEQQKLQYYGEAYSSYLGSNITAQLNRIRLYETTLLEVHGDSGGVNLGDTTDQSLWIALLARPKDSVTTAREAIAGKTLNLGFIPKIDNPQRAILPGRRFEAAASELIDVAIPLVTGDTRLPSNRIPLYRSLESSPLGDVLHEPGIIQVTLPTAQQLQLWSDIDPQEEGVNEMPPMLDDDDKRQRLLTWLRVRMATGAQTRLLWSGINAVMVTQRATVVNELLGQGNGEPDQRLTLTHQSVLPGSVRLTITPNGGKPEEWQEIDDLLSAGSEVPAPDLRQPPGRQPPPAQPSNVFALDAEAGVIRFGDGFRGKRPPFGATLQVSYDYSVGREGNVGASAINTAAALPDGIKVSNPVRTWGGAEAESLSEGEKQITGYLQHRDRLVTAEDFVTIVQRTPGVEIGRVEVLPAYHPDWSQVPGDAAGAVTLMLIPQNDPTHPNAPQPDQVFLNAVCAYLAPRRLVTTELYLYGPEYQKVWLSVGIKVVADASLTEAREAVRQALYDFLSPYHWPLRKSIIDRELVAVASRVPMVEFVNSLRMALDDDPEDIQIDLKQLELPQIMTITVSLGEATPIDQIRAQQPASTADGAGGATAGVQFVAVPVVPEECS